MRPLGLLEDFVRRAGVVGAPVGRVAVLVGVEVLRVGSKLTGFADGAVGAFGGIGPEDLGPIRVEDAFALGRDIRGHAERDGEGKSRAEHGVGDAGVAAGGVEEANAGAELLALEGVQDDGGGGAVLDGAAGVGPLRFAEDLNAGQLSREALQTHEGRIADAVEEGGAGFGCGQCSHGQISIRYLRNQPQIAAGAWLCDPCNKGCSY